MTSAVWALPTAAQYSEYAYEETRIESKEWVALELRVGPYQPSTEGAFQDAFDVTFDEQGPLVGGEIDYLLWRIPHVGLLGAGAFAGWSKYSGDSFIAPGTTERSDEETSLTLIPLAALASLRIDTLARKWSVPLIFAGKLGVDIIPWKSSTGGQSDGSGTAVGLRWAAQFALELDVFERRAARSLDEEWGINHTFLFFELFGSTASPVGDAVAWTAGLGFI
ncbi:MAG: MXAN_2562 family outer membrane beta-barrel protein, partial [Polyangiales bacterium]